MGGDEFCLLARDSDSFDALLARAADALSETGERFAIRCSHGAVVLKGEGTSPAEALRIADQRMYENKRGGRLAELRRCAGSQFDPAVVAAFTAALAPVELTPA
jgi:GGDEF domain-containing protein